MSREPTAPRVTPNNLNGADIDPVNLALISNSVALLEPPLFLDVHIHRFTHTFGSTNVITNTDRGQQKSLF